MRLVRERRLRMTRSAAAIRRPNQTPASSGTVASFLSLCSVVASPPQLAMAAVAAVFVHVRRKTTSAQHVAARHMDATFEKLVSSYLPLVVARPLLDLLLASPSPSLPVTSLRHVPFRLHRRGHVHFLRLYPRLFSLHPPLPLTLRLSPAASAALAAESAASSSSAATDRLHRLLAMSLSRSLPLRAVFRVWHELGLPDDFEDSVVAANPHLFRLRDNPKEPSTHVLELVAVPPVPFAAAVEKWRRSRPEDGKYAFELRFPPGMRLTKEYRKKVRAWQMLPYAGPYDAIGEKRKNAAKAARRAMEKRAVAVAHEFLSLTVEKMVEVEKISHFRKWFGIETNIRDVFLDHPGIFYLSAKGRRHTVFLREAYDRGRLVEPNPIYEARMRLVELMSLRRRGMGNADANADADPHGNSMGEGDELP